MKEIIIALLAGGLGLAMIFMGYRLSRVIIPLWGLLAGFALGASAASDAFSNAFIGTTAGILCGLLVGAVFAIFAYFFFELAIVLLGANVGYWLGVSFIELFGIEKGFLTAIVGIMLGIVFGLVFLFINAPKWFLIFFTSLGGSAAIVTALLLLFNKVSLDNLSYVAASQNIKAAWIWSIIAIGLFVIGVFFQIANTKDFELEQWRALQELVNEPINKK